MNRNELDRGLAQFAGHLATTAETFNRAAAEAGIPVRMDHSNAVAALERGVGLARVAPFWSRSDETGIVHQSQIETVVRCLVELLADQHRCGHVLGAMQSGKTTTSLALQWAGPILYALRGVKAYPFYLIGSQTSHEDQTRNELARFLAYYGDIEIMRSDAHGGPAELDAVFAMAPSLSNYREHVLRHDLGDFCPVPQLADNIHRRVGGQGVQKVADRCREATGMGFRPLIMIDEPQFGASDRIVVGDEGPERRSCLLVQIFDRIEGEIGGDRNDHWFVGLSATPFELNDLERVWEVRQSLTEAYSGFNFFNGRPISPGVAVVPPETMGLTEFAERSGVAFMANISMAAYVGTGRTFETHARRIGYEGDLQAYRGEVETALAEVIRGFASRSLPDGAPSGLCVRATNSNEATHALIERLRLDPGEVEVMEYFGAAAMNLSVKRFIAGRRSPGIPYVVFVTNRARMADAFPREVSFFMDFAQKASDLNSLLQGLLGRACGYGKRSTVVLSDTNANIVSDYVVTSGGYVHRTSRHSVAVGGYRRGAPTGMLKVERGFTDPVVAAFFRRIDAEVVAVHVRDGARLSPTRAARQAFRTGPVLAVSAETGLFDHLESPSVRAVLYPYVPGGFSIAREGETIRHARSGEEIGYQMSSPGNCRFTFRWSRVGDAAQGGAQGRAQGARDVGQHMEPTIYVEKYDPATGAVIDRDLERNREGSWRAFMVTFPLTAPIRELRAAEVAYPIERSVYDPWLEPDERALRDGA